MKTPFRLIFSSFGLLFSLTSVVAGYTLTDDDVVVAGGIILSCSYDFSDPNITIPNELDGQTVIGIADKSAGNGVFQNKGIQYVNLPETLEFIGDYAFYGNPIAQYFDFESLSLTSIGDYAFYIAEAGDIEGIQFSNTIEHIGNYAFYGHQIQDLFFEMAEQLKSIGDYAFYSEDVQAGDIYISNLPLLENIGAYAFHYYGGFVEIENNPSLQWIGDHAFYGCLTWINDCDALDSIAAYAFSGGWLGSCPNLRYIGDYAFYCDVETDMDGVSLSGCPNLVYIGIDALYMPNHVDHYGQHDQYSITLPYPGIDGYNYKWTANGNHYEGGSAVTVYGGLTAVLEPAYDVTFIVEHDGAPVEGAEITLTSMNHKYKGYTIPSGECVFTNLLAEVNKPYTIRREQYEDYTGWIDVIDTDVSEQVDLSLKTYTVNFTVSDGTGPVENATVTLNGYDPQTTNASGYISFEGLLPEEDIAYTVDADAHHSTSGTVSVFDSDINEYVYLELTRYTIIFSVSDGTNPVEGAVITLDSKAKATNASGIVEYAEILPEEGIVYTVIANGFANYAGTVTVVDQDVQVDIALTSSGGSGGFTQEDLDAAYQDGLVAGAVLTIDADDYEAGFQAGKESCGTDGIAMTAADMGVSIYPNPVNSGDVVSVDCPNFSKVVILSIKGEVLEIHTMQNVSTSNLESGVYFFNVHDTDGNVCPVKVFVH